MTTWKIALMHDESLLAEVRRHLSQPESGSRVCVHWDDNRTPLSAVVVHSGRPPSLPDVTVGTVPETQPVARGPWSLTPQEEWLVVVDDTGSTWAGAQPDGRFVALVLGADAVLPTLPAGFHATQNSQLAREAVRQLQQTPVGVLGLNAEGVPDVGTEERWRVALAALLERVLLLLPGPHAAAVRVTVLVEEHAAVKAGDDLTAVAEAVLLLMARSCRQGPRSVALALHAVKKGQHCALSAADALAWAWGSGDALAAADIQRWTSLGLLPERGKGPGVGDDITAALGGGPFDAGLWRRLCAGAEAEGERPGLAAYLRDRYEAHLRADPALLDAAVEANQALLYSRRFDVALLRREAEALARLGRRHGDDASVQLGMAVARLADRNRRGHLVPPEEAQAARALAHGLLDELPAEAAELCLRLAVGHMNALDWDAAESALPPEGSPLPLVVRGRVESTRGQIAANRGQPGLAAEYFDRAQTIFGKMRSPSREQEKRHTGAYQFSNRWALANEGPQQDRLAVWSRLSLRPADLRVLLSSSDPGSAWQQLDLLRWLAARPRDTAAECDCIFDTAERWHRGSGHPWPLIGLYRCAVLRAANAEPEDLAAALNEHAEDATSGESGPAMRLIALAIEVHRLALQRLQNSQRLERLRDSLAGELPLAGPWVQRGAALLDGGADWSGGEWIPQLLPFSMR